MSEGKVTFIGTGDVFWMETPEGPVVAFRQSGKADEILLLLEGQQQEIPNKDHVKKTFDKAKRSGNASLV